MLSRTKPLRRVAITGLGVISSIGTGREAFCRALQAGKSGVSKFRGENTLGFPFEFGGEVHDFDPHRWLKRLDPNSTGRTSQLAISAARLAIEDSGMTPAQLRERGCSVSVGTTDGESHATDAMVRQMVSDGIANMQPDLIRKVPADRVAGSVAREFGLAGEVMTISTACAAGNYAIGNAFDVIRSGETTIAIGGGAESMARKSLAGFYRLGAIAPEMCQPFDSNRAGIVAGEGSGMLILEDLETAVARGAHIYAEMLGYGLSCDAKHSTTPDQQSIELCMRRAHENASISPSDVDYICAHGTGTRVNDALEAAAIRSVFGEDPPPTSSIKSMLGHTMGAASALAAIASTLAIHEGFLPPTINSQSLDPECDLDIVPNEMRRAEPNVVQNNGFAFGGNNAIVLFRRFGTNDAQSASAN